MYIARTDNEVMMDIHEKMLHNIPYLDNELVAFSSNSITNLGILRVSFYLATQINKLNGCNSNYRHRHSQMDRNEFNGKVVIKVSD